MQMNTTLIYKDHLTTVVQQCSSVKKIHFISTLLNVRNWQCLDVEKHFASCLPQYCLFINQIELQAVDTLWTLSRQILSSSDDSSETNITATFKNFQINKQLKSCSSDDRHHVKQYLVSGYI